MEQLAKQARMQGGGGAKQTRQRNQTAPPPRQATQTEREAAQQQSIAAPVVMVGDVQARPATVTDSGNGTTPFTSVGSGPKFEPERESNEHGHQ